MRPAICLSTAVSTALAGAGVFVATPEASGIEWRAIDLAANPIEPYLDLVTNSLTNLGAIGSHWLDDPLPTLMQLAVNWAGYLSTTVSSAVATGQAFVAGLTNLPDQLQTLFHAVTTGDFEAAIATLIITVLSANPIPALVDRLLTIPYDIAGNAVSAALAALHAAQVPIGLAALNAGQATFAEIESTVRDFLHDLQTGDLIGALTQVIDAPAQILNAGLNSDTPGLPGLLTAVPDLTQTGFADAIVNDLPRTVAHAIGAPESPIGGDPTALMPSDLSDLDPGDIAS
ncbi:MAG TPA: hypothetical protein VFR27_03680 [Mycobacterium sp.]|nr:hypothetical protein [Mycobacterium sp.]